MTAYIITQVDVHDPETFDKYRKLAGPVLAKFGGEFLVRGGRMEVLEGTWAYPRGVIIRFPDRETAKKWHESAEYGAIKTLRHASAKANMVVVDGIDRARSREDTIVAAYVIVQVQIMDPKKNEVYRAQVPATLNKFGGEFIVRGGAMEVLEGKWAHPRCVVIRFPDMKSAKAWHASPEYAGPKVLREASADANMIVVEGV